MGVGPQYKHEVHLYFIVSYIHSLKVILYEGFKYYYVHETRFQGVKLSTHDILSSLDNIGFGSILDLGFSVKSYLNCNVTQVTGPD